MAQVTRPPPLSGRNSYLLPGAVEALGLYHSGLREIAASAGYPSRLLAVNLILQCSWL